MLSLVRSLFTPLAKIQFIWSTLECFNRLVKFSSKHFLMLFFVLVSFLCKHVLIPCGFLCFHEKCQYYAI